MMAARLENRLLTGAELGAIIYMAPRSLVKGDGILRKQKICLVGLHLDSRGHLLYSTLTERPERDSPLRHLSNVPTKLCTPIGKFLKAKGWQGPAHSVSRSCNLLDHEPCDTKAEKVTRICNLASTKMVPPKLRLCSHVEIHQ